MCEIEIDCNTWVQSLAKWAELLGPEDRARDKCNRSEIMKVEICDRPQHSFATMQRTWHDLQTVCW